MSLQFDKCLKCGAILGKEHYRDCNYNGTVTQAACHQPMKPAMQALSDKLPIFELAALVGHREPGNTVSLHVDYMQLVIAAILEARK